MLPADSKKRKQFILEKAPLWFSVPYMTIPSLFSSLIILFNISTDAYFLKSINLYASSSITLSWPIICVIIAISNTFALGSSIRASHYLGAKKFIQARSIVSTTVLVCFIINIVLVCLILINLHSIVIFVGADQNSTQNTCQYLEILLPGIIFQSLAITGGMYLRTEGHSSVIFITLLIQSIINIGLNIILVLKWHFGIQGAASANTISAIIQFIVYYCMLCNRNSLLQLSWNLIKIDLKYFKTVITYGSSAFFLLILASISQIILNREASSVNTNYLTAITIMILIMNIAYSLQIGITNGIEPLMAYSFGAQNKKRLFEIIKWLGILSGILGLILTLTMTEFTDSVSRMFTHNQTGIKLARDGVILAGYAMLFAPLPSMIMSITISTGHSLIATSTNITCQFINILLIILLFRYQGGHGLLISQAVAAMIGNLLTILMIPYVVDKVRNMPNKFN